MATVTAPQEFRAPTARFDTTRFPLVVLVIGAEIGPRTIAEIEHGYAELFARGERFAVIVDARAVRSLPTNEVRRLATRMVKDPNFHTKQARYQISAAHVFESHLVRVAARVVSWARVPEWPRVTPDTFEEAIAWSLARLHEAGLEPDAPLSERDR